MTEIIRLIRFHRAKKHPKHMGRTEIEAFLSHLAVNRNVAALTQRQALNAIIILYRHGLDMPVEDKLEPIRARRHRRHPVVLVRNDVQRIFCNINGIHLSMDKLLYGGGLRLMECIRLRVQDLDHATHAMEKNIAAVKSPLDDSIEPSGKRTNAVSIR